MMKKCRICGSTKPHNDYYHAPASADGFASICKECVKQRVKANRAKNIDHYKAFDAARAMRPDRVAARKAYQKTASGKDAIARARRAYIDRAPERRAAHVILGNALRDGRAEAWPVCALPECCGTKLEAHHPDYSRPLDVVWLCNKHHRQCHGTAG